MKPFCCPFHPCTCPVQTDKDRLQDAYTALERKAQLYDRLAQGHADDNDEQYNVDFLRKGFLVHEDRAPAGRVREKADRTVDTAGLAVSSSGAKLLLFALTICIQQSLVMKLYCLFQPVILCTHIA